MNNYFYSLEYLLDFASFGVWFGIKEQTIWDIANENNM